MSVPSRSSREIRLRRSFVTITVTFEGATKVAALPQKSERSYRKKGVSPCLPDGGHGVRREGICDGLFPVQQTAGCPGGAERFFSQRSPHGSPALLMERRLKGRSRRFEQFAQGFRSGGHPCRHRIVLRFQPQTRQRLQRIGDSESIPQDMAEAQTLHKEGGGLFGTAEFEGGGSQIVLRNGHALLVSQIVQQGQALLMQHVRGGVL